MKIVAISDTHGYHNHVDLPDGDVLIHAGDFLRLGKHTELHDFNEWIKKQEFVYKIIVGGNHDWRLRDFYERTFSHGYYLEQSGVEIEGKTFWGSPWTPIIRYDKPWVYERKSKLVKTLWNEIPEDLDVLITHGPPRSILDTTWDGRKEGCYELLNAVVEKKPKNNLFGHIHESYGKLKRYGINFYNVSVLNQNFNLENKPTVFEI